MTVSAIALVLVGMFVVNSQLKSYDRDLEIYTNFLEQEAKNLQQSFVQLIAVADLLIKNPIIINTLDKHVKKELPTRIAGLMVKKKSGHHWRDGSCRCCLFNGFGGFVYLFEPGLFCR